MSTYMRDCINWDYGDTCPRGYGAFCRKRQESIGAFCCPSCPDYTNLTPEQQRLAAVRALVLEYGSDDSPAIEALGRVWPEAVEGVR